MDIGHVFTNEFGESLKELNNSIVDIYYFECDFENNLDDYHHPSVYKVGREGIIKGDVFYYDYFDIGDAKELSCDPESFEDNNEDDEFDEDEYGENWQVDLNDECDSVHDLASMIGEHLWENLSEEGYTWTVNQHRFYVEIWQKGEMKYRARLYFENC